MAKQVARLSTWIERETEKAIAVKFYNGRMGSNGSELVWLPKSQCVISHPENFADPERMLIDVPLWLVLKQASKSDLNRFDGFSGIIEQ